MFGQLGGMGYQKITYDRKGMHFTQGVTDGINRQEMTFGRHGLESISMTQANGYPGMGFGSNPLMNDPFMSDMLMNDIFNPNFGFGCGMPSFGRLGLGSTGMMMSMMGNSLGFGAPIMMGPMPYGYEYSHRGAWGERTKYEPNEPAKAGQWLDVFDKGMEIVKKHSIPLPF